jgi:hypothetical protein
MEGKTCINKDKLKLMNENAYQSSCHSQQKIGK